MSAGDNSETVVYTDLTASHGSRADKTIRSTATHCHPALTSLPSSFSQQLYVILRIITIALTLSKHTPENLKHSPPYPGLYVHTVLCKN